MKPEFKHKPFTLLMRDKTTGQYELFVCIPVDSDEGIDFAPQQPASKDNDNDRIKNMILFIDCQVTDAQNGEAFVFKRFTLPRKFSHPDETIEVRVRIRDEESEEKSYIGFNRSIVFFDDAMEMDKDDEKSSGSAGNQKNLAIGLPYTFIGKPTDFFSRLREEDPKFNIHFLLPRSRTEVLPQTVVAGIGSEDWIFDPGKENFMELAMKESGGGSSASGVKGLTSRNPDTKIKPQNKFTINIREGLGRVDKPETPPLGSSGGG
jgi:hypothetical protein